jgi:hypothetical protein
LNVSGTAGVFLNSGATQVGRQGTGVMNISGNGTVNGSAQNIAVVGRIAGGSGTVNIDGSGASWNTGSNLFIGTDVDFNTATASGPGGTGLVNLSNGGSLTASNILVGGTGTLQGTGTVSGNVAVAAGGTVAAGNSPGTLSIVGNLDLGVSSNTVVELGGLLQGISYDLIDVADDGSTLAGIASIASGAVFDVDYFGAFSATLGDSFDVLVADDIVANLSLISFLMPTLTFGLVWDQAIVLLESGREALRLEVVADGGAQAPAPGALLLFGPALGAMALLRRRRRG